MTAIAVLGIVSVSCSTDSAEMENESLNRKATTFSKENKEVFAKEGDSISAGISVGSEIHIEGSVDVDGPGDDLVIIPPIKP